MKRLLVVALILTGCASTQAPTANKPGPAADTALERSVFYFPNKTSYGPIPDGVETLTLTTPDGLSLQAWYLPPPEGRPLVLYFHGNGGNITGTGGMFEAFRKLQLGVLAIDYRGYGESQGDPSEQGLYLDALTAYDEAIKRGFKPERILVYGHSLGGGVATYLAHERPCAKLILSATFTSTTDVARFRKGSLAARQIDGYDNLERIADLTLPVFILHGDQDQTIPCEMGERLHAACKTSELWKVQGANHNNLASDPEFLPKLKSFVDR